MEWKATLAIGQRWRLREASLPKKARQPSRNGRDCRVIQQVAWVQNLTRLIYRSIFYKENFHFLFAIQTFTLSIILRLCWSSGALTFITLRDMRTTMKESNLCGKNLQITTLGLAVGSRPTLPSTEALIREALAKISSKDLADIRAIQITLVM